MKHVSVTVKAKEWGYSPGLVRRWCMDGRIKGAYKPEGSRAYIIPANAERPPRLKPGALHPMQG